jgi:murein DD-endopeptidase MepM/ murein hydrolase activator NlpD
VRIFLLLLACAETLPQQTSTIHELRQDVACGQLAWPVDGPLSSAFGRRDGQPHDGIDVAVPEGTVVRAACDGRVAYAGDKLRGYGRLVILAHAGGLATVYAHNSRLQVKEGDAVLRGQEIARSGQTGRATAPHVHFEVRRDNRPEDPLKYLPPRQSRIVEARRGEPASRAWGRPPDGLDAPTRPCRGGCP